MPIPRFLVEPPLYILTATAIVYCTGAAFVQPYWIQHSLMHKLYHVEKQRRLNEQIPECSRCDIEKMRIPKSVQQAALAAILSDQPPETTLAVVKHQKTVEKYRQQIHHEIYHLPKLDVCNEDDEVKSGYVPHHPHTIREIFTSTIPQHVIEEQEAATIQPHHHV